VRATWETPETGSAQRALFEEPQWGPAVTAGASAEASDRIAELRAEAAGHLARADRAETEVTRLRADLEQARTDARAQVAEARAEVTSQAVNVDRAHQEIERLRREVDALRAATAGPAGGAEDEPARQTRRRRAGAAAEQG